MLDAASLEQWLLELGGHRTADPDKPRASNQDFPCGVHVVRVVVGYPGTSRTVVPCPCCGLTGRRHSFFCRYSRRGRPPRQSHATPLRDGTS